MDQVRKWMCARDHEQSFLSPLSMPELEGRIGTRCQVKYIITIRNSYYNNKRATLVELKPLVPYQLAPLPNITHNPMLNVSRTRVPESWLSSVATRPSVGYNTLDREAFVTLEKSRFSVSTIDSELFPELLSWSALTDALPPYCPQSIPSDITKPGDTDTFTETIHEIDSMHEADIVYEVDIEANSVFLSVLDPTTLATGFDYSCFDGLDENLIHNPLDSFIEACWLDAVGASSSSPRASTPTQLLNKPTGRRKPCPVTIPKPEEHEYYNGERAPMSPVGSGAISGAASPRPDQISPWSRRNTGFSTLSDDDEATSFILFEAPLLTPNRYDSVGRFPVPSRNPHKNVISNRIATFCSNLPAFPVR